MIYLNQSIDTLLEQIGKYRKSELVISFSETFTAKDNQEKNRIINSILHGGAFDYEKDGVTGADWYWKFYKGIIDTYIKLIPGAAVLEKIRKEIDSHKRNGEELQEKSYDLQKSLEINGENENGKEHFRINFGVYIEEAFLNAFTHGNNESFLKRIEMSAWYGEKGMLFSVKNEGDGFDVEETIRKMLSGDRSYSRNHVKDGFCGGSGINLFYYGRVQDQFDNNDFIFSYNKKGTEWMYLTRFGPNTFVPEQFIDVQQ